MTPSPPPELTPPHGPPLHLALPAPLVREQTLLWLRQDAPGFDAAAVAVGDATVTATLYAKSDLVLAGLPFFRAVFAHLGCAVHAHAGVCDGTVVRVRAGAQKAALASVVGPAASLLHGERTALNALAECSAVASAAAAAAAAARMAGWHGVVAGTRKTAPGLRVLQKYGMVVGGMDAHRLDLSGMVMVKDNHIAAAGSIGDAVAAARKVAGFSTKIDVEASDEAQAVAACDAGADVVMLDNFASAEFARVARVVKARRPGVLVEASGGVTLDTLKDYCIGDADVISFSVNRYASPVDMSLKIDVEQQQSSA